MTESTENTSELANSGGSEDSVLGQLAQIRERNEKELEAALQGGAQEGAEAEDEEVREEEEGAERAADQVVEDDDPEIDLGEIKLKKSELKAGYMKDADYRRKTAEAAEAKRAAQAQVDAIRQEREQRANHLDAYLHLAHQQLIGDQQHLARLAQEDPAAWVAEKQAMEQRHANFQALLQERQALANRMTAEQEQEVSEWRKAERDKLHEKLPEWKDPQKAGAEQRLVAEFLIQTGYSQDELKDLFDHRALIVARKAALYDQMQSAKSSVKEKQAKPEPGKPVKPGPAQNNNPQATQAYNEALRRARKTGKEDDVMALLAAKRAK